MPKTQKNPAEDAVRNYLLFLDDPSKLRDEPEIQRRTKAVLDADDPIAKLQALAALEKVAKIDEEPLRLAFVEHARAWADSEGVPVTAFLELKVPDEVLKRAGFRVPIKGAATRAAAARNGAALTRAPAVRVEDIKAHVLKMSGTFLMGDVTAKTGSTPATTKKALDELIEAGEVERLGPLTGYTGRGRAPIQYSRKG